MITGFNTDIEFGGTTYHVQTEDKGLDTPLILSLVYVGGTIIASKRTPYDDLVAAGFDQKVLTERLQRQHKLICAAIRSGRVEDLKQKMGERDKPKRASGRAAEKRPKAAGQERPGAEARPERKAELPAAPPPAEAPALATTPEAAAAAPPAAVPPAAAPAEEVAEEIPFEYVTEIIEEEPPAALYLSLLEDEGEFRAGQLATIKIHVGRGPYGHVPVPGATVTVKVLGTTFRPLILSTKTDPEGVANIRALLPRFTSGRAAIIIRAAADGGEAELRRIIHQA